MPKPRKVNKEDSKKRLLNRVNQPYGESEPEEKEVQRTNIGIPVDIHATIRTYALKSKGQYTMNSIIVEALDLWLLQNEVKPEVVNHG